MRVLVTGHDGYIGTVLVPLFQAAGHEVVGLDSGLFSECVFGEPQRSPETLWKDIRDIEVSDLDGFDAVVHLAAISNDPLGDLNPQCTFDINHLASTRLAQFAKEAGIQRFLYSSSCSVYGASSPDDVLCEDASFNPVTPYGISKVRVEEDLNKLADDDFSPTYFRNATAYGVSPRLRGDLVVNNLVGWAYTKGSVFIKSDGTPWRPLVHIEDISRAFLAGLEAAGAPPLALRAATRRYRCVRHDALAENTGVSTSRESQDVELRSQARRTSADVPRLRGGNQDSR